MKLLVDHVPAMESRLASSPMAKAAPPPSGSYQDKPELPHAQHLLDRLPRTPRGLWLIGATPTIASGSRFERPEQNLPSRQAQRGCRALPDRIYTNRNIVERHWARLKEWPAVTTYSDRTGSSFSGLLYLAAALDHLK